MPQSAKQAEARDEQLMRAYCGGDTDAFKSLYERHRIALFRYVLNSCDNQATANELYQDIWANVIKGRYGYDAQTPFKAWLYRIAKNRLTDHYRQHARRPATVELNVETASEMHSQSSVTQLQTPLQPDEIAQLQQSADAMQTALTALPETQRQAIMMRHIAGMSIQEIAITTGEQAETIKSRLRYALVKLRATLRNPAGVR